MTVLAFLGVLSLWTGGPHALEAPRLVRSIELPGVEGRLDHLALDERRGRLFVAALASGSAEVVDLGKGAVVRSLAGLSRPQGTLFLPEADRLLVSSGGDGRLTVFDGGSLERVAEVQVGLDADELRFDAKRGLVVVGQGQGGLTFVDSKEWKVVGEVRLPGHPESFQIDPEGLRAWVNVPSQRIIALVDLEERAVAATWPLEGASANFPMALAPDSGRLFVGCRTPPALLLVDAASGKSEIAGELSSGADGLFVTPDGARALVTSGAGFLEVFERGADGAYALALRMPTAEGARTGILTADGKRLYLAVPHRGDQRAEVREYDLAGGEDSFGGNQRSE